MQDFDEVSELLAEQRQEPTPATKTVKPAKVTFSEEQQAAVNDIIRRVQGRAGGDARALAARLEVENLQLKAAMSSTTDPALQEARSQLAVTALERDAYKKQLTDEAINQQLRAAVGEHFVSADIAIDQLRKRTRVGENGKLIVIDQHGNEALTSTLDAATLGDAVESLKVSMPFLARGSVRPGYGSVEATTPAGTNNEAMLRQIFGKHANGAKANALALRDEALYKRLRIQAKTAGII